MAGWLEINVSDAVLPPSSGLNFVIMESYPLYCCLKNYTVQQLRKPLLLHKEFNCPNLFNQMW